MRKYCVYINGNSILSINLIKYWISFVYSEAQLWKSSYQYSLENTLNGFEYAYLSNYYKGAHTWSSFEYLF